MQTDWEAAYHAGETPWEKGHAHPALLRFLAEAGELGGEILVPGCGFGHDVRALSTPRNRVLGLDLAPFAISQAETFPRAGDETYLLADLFALPNEFNARFDFVFEHTCFCAIDPLQRSHYVETVARLLKPNGHLLAIFFLNPDHDEPGPPFGVTRQELATLFEPHFVFEKEWVPQSTHRGREGRELMSVLARSSSL